MAKSRETSIARKNGKAEKAAKDKRNAKSAPMVTAATVSLGGGEVQLSVGEVNILAVFRKYLMTPGRMLCLNNTEIGTMKRSLEKLTAAGLLIPEDFKGSYSLTRSGFQAMNELG